MPKPIIIWTDEAIDQWCRVTFAGTPTLYSRFERVKHEMAELTDALRSDLPNGEIMTEIADVIISLRALAALVHTQGDTESYVNSKMVMNARRTWVSRGDGTGRHKKGEQAE
jgi:hypothetical protein